MTPRISFCDDLDVPLMAVIMDTEWWGKVKAEAAPWLTAQDCRFYDSHRLIFFSSEKTKLMFLMRWP